MSKINHTEINSAVQNALDTSYCETTVYPINLADFAKSHGILVYVSDFNLNKTIGAEQKLADGIIFYSDPPKIYLNKSQAANRMRFTLAHELGHYFLNHRDKESGVYFDTRSEVKSDNERDANAFAAELLMPEKKVKEVFEKYESFPLLDWFAEEFNVSKDAMRIRLENLGLSYV